MDILFLFLTVAFAGCAYAAPSKPENTHLVTMRKAELMEIIDCVSRSKDVKICEQFSECEKMMAPLVIRAHRKCLERYGGVTSTTCKPDQELFSDPRIPPKIFECIADRVEKETPEEQIQMVEFETCCRRLYASHCLNYPKPNPPQDD